MLAVIAAVSFQRGELTGRLPLAEGSHQGLVACIWLPRFTILRDPNSVIAYHVLTAIIVIVSASALG